LINTDLGYLNKYTNEINVGKSRLVSAGKEKELFERRGSGYVEIYPDPILHRRITGLPNEKAPDYKYNCIFLTGNKDSYEFVSEVIEEPFYLLISLVVYEITPSVNVVLSRGVRSDNELKVEFIPKG